MLITMKRACIAFLLLVVVESSWARPKYIECLNTYECPVSTCCVLGTSRFSIPSCMPLKEVGEECRPRQRPRDASLVYPDNQMVNMTDVYYSICPCAEGLICSERSGFCEHHIIDDNELHDLV